MKNQILIIEDQLSTRKLLSHYLQASFEVVEMENALNALAWLQGGGSPDAIIADIMMPEMTGIEFLKAVKSANLKMPPVLMLSSVENSNDKISCFKNGAKDYLLKPFNPTELSFRLHLMLANHLLTKSINK